MVTSRKASEKNVGNRGSKSVIFISLNFTVKEQRVNGSCFINKNLMKLRCTLMGNERSYQVKIPSNQIIQRRFYSIEPYLKLTQLIKALLSNRIHGRCLCLCGGLACSQKEGCFLVIIRKSKKKQKTTKK
jgi:hypothetical protein